VNFEDQLSEEENAAWGVIAKCHYQVWGGGNHKAGNCRDLVTDYAESYKCMGCITSLKCVSYTLICTSSQKTRGIEQRALIVISAGYLRLGKAV